MVGPTPLPTQACATEQLPTFRGSGRIGQHADPWHETLGRSTRGGVMFEAAELGQKLSKADYAAQLPELRAGLLQAQLDLRAAGVSVIIIVSGADGAGKGETVNRLYEWLDPRGLETNVFGPLSDEERDRPAYWRFWRSLPARGRIGIFFGSWYTDPIIRRVYRKSRKAELEHELNRIVLFERLLADDGALFVKFWLHLSKKAQRKRLEKLASSRKTAWRVSPLEFKHLKLYRDFAAVDERALKRTDTGHAPWHIVAAADARYRELAVGRTLLQAIQAQLAKASARRPTSAAPVVSGRAPGAPARLLGTMAPAASIDDKTYARSLDKLQGRLNGLVRSAREKGRSSVIVFEGWDAAGKGGCIRRLTAAMDARSYRVIPIAAPTDEERAQHYLWRFWRHVPRAGALTIYDRSWYGRVLVERVEGFAQKHEWARAYSEINNFEEQLAEHGIVLIKFWLHVSQDEQLRRFQDRQTSAYKQHKITAEDWRNREKWEAYEAAVDEMIAKTSTRTAPWTLVAANDKRVARLRVLETVARRLAQAF
jgi:AMP-polyphosphate phosphotransferase